MGDGFEPNPRHTALVDTQLCLVSAFANRHATDKPQAGRHVNEDGADLRRIGVASLQDSKDGCVYIADILRADFPRKGLYPSLARCCVVRTL